MRRIIFLLFITYNLSYSLELDVSSGVEAELPISIINIRDDKPFLCQEERDTFDTVKTIICAFERAPRERFKTLNNNFFAVSSIVKDLTFFIKIRAYKKMRLKSIIFDLTKSSDIYEADIKMSKHWVILGYVDKMPFLNDEKTPALGLNLPIELAEYNHPTIGGLDLKGNPIDMQKSDDVSGYMDVKAYFDDKDYEKSLSLTKELMGYFPNTIFFSELLLYKIKSEHKLKMWPEVATDAKEFLRNFSSDDGVAEVLAYMGQAYSKVGQYSDADYFYDRLFDEHAGSYFTCLGMIYKAEQAYDMGQYPLTLEYYKKALYETKDIPLAARAAYLIVQYYIELSKPNEADIYIDKIVKSKDDYFYENFNESVKMTEELSTLEDPKGAAKVMSALLKYSSKKLEDYQEMLRNEAMWWSKTDDKLKAVEVTNKYLEMYPYGMYTDEVAKAKDALFFEPSDRNYTATIDDYNKLINEYAGDSIGTKAIYKKGEYYLENKKYSDVLAMQDRLRALNVEEYPKAAEFVTTSAIEVMKQVLSKKDCNEVIRLSKEYKIELSGEWDVGLYECGMSGGDYALAQRELDKHNADKDIKERSQWLKRKIVLDYKMGNYKEVIKVANDLKILSQSDKNEEYNSVLRELFDSYYATLNSDGMITTIQAIQSYDGLKLQDIDRLTQVATLAVKKNDAAMVVTYATKVMELQAKTKTYTQTPYIEFSLATALMELKKFNQAKKIYIALLERELQPLATSRTYYQIGAIEQIELNDTKAKVAYEKSVQADKNSPWAGLSSDALKMMK
ncbi:MAG: flagellar protein [Helicobacteraceae bacterium]|nr:flagellar protein [Helicobacteraceae bacterium]